jgi:hypothetical protein
MRRPGRCRRCTLDPRPLSTPAVNRVQTLGKGYAHGDTSMPQKTHNPSLRTWIGVIETEDRLAPFPLQFCQPGLRTLRQNSTQARILPKSQPQIDVEVTCPKLKAIALACPICRNPFGSGGNLVLLNTSSCRHRCEFRTDRGSADKPPTYICLRIRSERSGVSRCYSVRNSD